jgi:hypothetical protein
MTSLAFGLGVLPLVIASGAGSASQRAIGTGVIGGMITGTALAVIFVPVFFVVVRTLFKGSARQRTEADKRHAEAAGITGRNPSMTKKLIPTALAAAMLLAGCSLIPTYERPAAPVPTTFPGDPSQPAGQAAGRPAVAGLLHRPAPAGLIQTALANNRDLRVSVLNIEQARAQFQIERSALFPALGLTGSGSRSSPTPQARQQQGSVSSQYSVNFGFTAWELDFFGRIRSLKDQALAQYLATEETRKAAQISLIASVANTAGSRCWPTTSCWRSRARRWSRAKSRCASPSCASTTACRPSSTSRPPTRSPKGPRAYCAAAAPARHAGRERADPAAGRSRCHGRPGPAAPRAWTASSP